jgi:transcriptional regulator with XRE-family HTH domain
MTIREDFARNLRKLRHARGLSQEALAYEAGIDRTYISALERGVYSATIDMVAKIAAVLEVDPAILLQKPIRSSRRKA